MCPAELHSELKGKPMWGVSCARKCTDTAHSKHGKSCFFAQSECQWHLIDEKTHSDVMLLEKILCPEKYASVAVNSRAGSPETSGHNKKCTLAFCGLFWIPKKCGHKSPRFLFWKYDHPYLCGGVTLGKNGCIFSFFTAGRKGDEPVSASSPQTSPKLLCRAQLRNCCSTY